MTTTDPLSLTQTKRLAGDADTILLRATRPADLETPIGAFLRLDDGGPAYLLESVEGGERLGRYSFLGVGPRRLLEVRDGVARTQTRPVDGRRRTRPTCRSTIADAADPLDGHPRVRPAPPRPAGRGHAALHRRRGRRPRLRRGLDLRADRPAARPRPGRRPDGRVHRDRPRHRVRPPDPHALGDRVAPHRGAGPRGSLPDRRGGDLRGARADGAPVRRRAGGRRLAPAATAPRPGDGRRPIETSLGRDEYIRAVEVAKDAIAAGEAIQVVLARRQSFDLPTDPATGVAARRHRALPRAPPGQPEPVPVLRADAVVRGRRRVARSCCSRSRATG